MAFPLTGACLVSTCFYQRQRDFWSLCKFSWNWAMSSKGVHGDWQWHNLVTLISQGNWIKRKHLTMWWANSNLPFHQFKKKVRKYIFTQCLLAEFQSQGNWLPNYFFFLISRSRRRTGLCLWISRRNYSFKVPSFINYWQFALSGVSMAWCLLWNNCKIILSLRLFWATRWKSPVAWFPTGIFILLDYRLCSHDNSCTHASQN